MKPHTKNIKTLSEEKIFFRMVEMNRISTIIFTQNNLKALRREILFHFFSHKNIFRFFISILWQLFGKIKLRLGKLTAFRIKIDSVAFMRALFKNPHSCSALLFRYRGISMQNHRRRLWCHL